MLTMSLCLRAVLAQMDAKALMDADPFLGPIIYSVYVTVLLYVGASLAGASRRIVLRIECCAGRIYTLDWNGSIRFAICILRYCLPCIGECRV